jgi:hypothetical protein
MTPRRKRLVCECGNPFLGVRTNKCAECRYEAHKARMRARERTEAVKARKRARYRQKANERQRLEARWQEILLAVQRRQKEAA